MSRPLKRARAGGARAVARPIDKELKVVNLAGIDNTQDAVTLKTTTFPGTVVGLRWSLGAVQDAGTAVTQLTWAIIVTQDGQAASTIATSAAADMYTPEQDVLAFGSAVSTGTDLHAERFEGTTKTMRKLKQGDVLQLIAISEATNTWLMFGVIQFFFKT